MFPLPILILILCVRRYAKWAERCLILWLFGCEREEDGRSVDDRVPLHQVSGALFRKSVGEAAYVCRRGAIPDDDRRRLFADWKSVFPGTEVRPTGGPATLVILWRTSILLVSRRLWSTFAWITAPSSSGRRRGAAGPPSRLPQTHNGRLPKAQRRGREAYIYGG